jgi:hypothetical protein
VGHAAGEKKIGSVWPAFGFQNLPTATSQIRHFNEPTLG